MMKTMACCHQTNLLLFLGQSYLIHRDHGRLSYAKEPGYPVVQESHYFHEGPEDRYHRINFGSPPGWCDTLVSSAPVVIYESQALPAM